MNQAIVGSCDCMTKTPDIHHHDSTCKYRLIVERNAAEDKLAALEKSITDLSHPNIKDVLAQRDEAREDYSRTCKQLLETMAQRDELLAALEEVDRFAKSEPALCNDEEAVLRQVRAAIAAVKGKP